MIVPFVSLPGRYAKALFEIGKEKNILSELSDNFEKFTNYILQSKNIFSRYAKRNNVRGVCNAIGDVLHLNTIFVSFINVLFENSRLHLINNIADIFNKATLKERNEHNVTIYSSSDLNLEQKHEIEKTIQKLFNATTNVEYAVDKSILGGIIIKTDEIMIDASSKSVIQQLEKHLKSTEIL